MAGPQGNNGGVDGPGSGPQGGSVTISVGPNDTVVEVKDPSSGEVSSIPVTPGKDVTLPVPNLPGGAFFSLRVGDGKRMRVLIVEVIAPSP